MTTALIELGVTGVDPADANNEKATTWQLRAAEKIFERNLVFIGRWVWGG